MELGVYQGSGRGPGYSLALSTGSHGSLKLLRTSGSGTVVVEAYREALHMDAKPHLIQWTRDTNGYMNAALDGKRVLNVRDRGTTGGFDGVNLINRGGSWGLHRITVRGPQ